MVSEAPSVELRSAVEVWQSESTLQGLLEDFKTSDVLYALAVMPNAGKWGRDVGWRRAQARPVLVNLHHHHHPNLRPKLRNARPGLMILNGRPSYFGGGNAAIGWPVRTCLCDSLAGPWRRQALTPPLMLMIWPVILVAPGPHRKRAMGAMSAGVGRPRPARLRAESARPLRLENISNTGVSST